MERFKVSLRRFFEGAKRIEDGAYPSGALVS
jgi:hypothetical protein